MQTQTKKKLPVSRIILWTILAIEILALVSAGPFIYSALFGKATGFSHMELEKFEKAYQESDYFVGIVVERIKDGEERYGSLCGSVIEINGEFYILTVAHIQKPDEKIFKILVFSREFQQEAKLVGYHRGLDVALLKFSDPKFVYSGPVAKFGDSSKLDDGDKIMIIGLNDDVAEKTMGLVMDRWWSVFFNDSLICTATAAPGYSGGPILNVDGEMVGMATTIFPNLTQGMATHTYGPKINAIKEVLADLKSGKQIE